MQQTLAEQYGNKELLDQNKEKVKSFQMGGPMGGAEGVAPVPTQGPSEIAAPPQAPQGDIVEMVIKYKETRSPEDAVMIADSLVSMMDQEQAQVNAIPAARMGGNIQRVAPIFKKTGEVK